MSNPNTLQKFITHIRTVGLPLAAYYYVLLPKITISPTEASESETTIDLLCDSVNLPGLNIMSSEVRVFGEVTDMPFGINYPPLHMTFLLDNDFSARAYFEDWNHKVIDRATRSLGYYKEYVRDIQLIATDRNGKPTFGLKLYEAWPKSISDQQLASGAKDVMRLEVNLVYRYWERLEFNAGGDGTPKVYPKPKGLETAIITEETEGNANLSGINGPGSLGGGIGGYALTQFGPPTAAEFASSGKSLSALLGSSGMTAPGNASFGSQLGGLFGSTGFQMGSFATAIGQLGTAVNTIAGPIAAASTAIGTVAGTLGSINSLLSSVGIHTGLGASANAMNQAAGKLASVSQLSNIPGSLTSIGANMGAAGGAITEATKQIANFPGASSAITGALNNIGSVFSKRGSSLGNIGNTL